MSEIDHLIKAIGYARAARRTERNERLKAVEDDLRTEIQEAIEDAIEDAQRDAERETA